MLMFGRVSRSCVDSCKHDRRMTLRPWHHQNKGFQKGIGEIMSKRIVRFVTAVILCLGLLCAMNLSALASEDDNSLSSLGITSEGSPLHLAMLL